ncbi:MAG: NAD(P)/FAD-dependent oxidoreductase [Candidatus Dadabacteria bacterium]|nr:NAD(P)/FAD-dependent oxidoreductase [Candidatus Dadabacteria bacterium]
MDPDKYRLPVKYGPEMRILVVGGGIAGLTLTGLLQQRGFKPTLVEQIPEYGTVGYVIVLWPSGSRILKGLGVYRSLLDVGLQFTTYNVSDERGQMLHSYSVQNVIEKYGPMLSTYRPDLINVIKEAVDPDSIRMSTTVDKIDQTNDEVYVTFSDGTEETYDLVVGCDGVRSKIRDLVFGDVPLSYSGMTGWSFWVKPNIAKTLQIAEYWGTGKFFGIWPTKGRLSVFTSIRDNVQEPDPVESRIDRIQETFKNFGGLVPAILEGLNDPNEIFHGYYNDLRMKKWHKGRVVLVGDAAHAILPTAGGGVSMAMESAAVLVDELCRADSKYIEQAFESYITRRRSRVDKIQNQSRMMSKFAFADSRLVSSIRDFLMRFYSNKLHVRYWDSMLKEPI